MAEDQYDTEDEKITGVPLIFMFQPTEFIVAKGEKLREWEEHMQKNVGIGAFAELRSDRVKMGVETTSISPGAGSDDCDYHILEM